MTEPRLKIAVFIDFDNIEIGVKSTLSAPFDIGVVLDAVKERGEVVTKVAYSDWKRAGDYSRQLSQHAIRMVQRNLTPGGDKNGADINLALDALEMAFTHAHINAFVIVGGDSDFITLVEKLKQYDRKVYVVGGRAFTSQVMQKNCTEFIAYENVAPAPERSRPQKPARGERQRGPATQVMIEQALPLVQRALKVLVDREVSPQLGLLKSTLLQLDSSFSERDYGAGTFREFADKLAEHGLVTLREQGRSTLVELRGEAPSVAHPAEAVREPARSEREPARSEREPARSEREPARSEEAPPLREILEQPDSGPGPAEQSLGDGVALVRRVLGETTTAPRWPMYPRQFKQFLKNAQPDFDERRYGSINDLMRACQKDGLLRLERDRQGALRVFAPGASSRASVPHGWGVGHREHGGNGRSHGHDGAEPEMSAAPSEEPVTEVVAEPVPPPVIEAQITQVIDQPEPKAKRARSRKAATAEKAPTEKKKAAPRKKKTS